MRTNNGGRLDPRWAGYALLVAAIAVLYWQSVVSLWQRWQPDPSYSHGWLIFGISAWLVWREAHAGSLDEGQPSMLGAIALLACGAIWLLAMAGSIGVVQWLLLPAMLFAAAFALFGWAAFRQLWFPLGFTLFAIPIWNWLAPILQDITTRIVGMALMVLRVPALLDGNRVDLPAGAFEIVEGCSGMHYFMVSGTLASLYGWLWYRQLAPTLVLIGVALAAAMVANWLRVFLVIYAGYLTDMQHFLVQVDHYYFGWGMFTLMMVPVFMLARRLEPGAEVTRPRTGSPDAGHVHWLPWAGAAFAGLVVAPVAWWLLTQSAARSPPDALPQGQAGWMLLGPARPDWEPRYRGADAKLGGGYWRDGQGVDTWVVFYERPSQGRELANSTNGLANRRDGRLELRGREAILTAPGGQRMIRYVHIVGGRESTGTRTAKLHQIVGTLSGQPEAALLAVSATCNGDCDQARALLGDFENDMGGALRAAIAGRPAMHGKQTGE